MRPPLQPGRSPGELGRSRPEGVSARGGVLLVEAEDEPPDDEQFLLTVLTQQLGAALTTARFTRAQRDHAAELPAVREQLEARNARLSTTVADLEYRAEVAETLADLLSSGAGEVGIVRAVHELTGLPVLAEDVFGNARSWAGVDAPPRHRPGRRRSELLRQAQRDGEATVRDGDHLLALACSRGQVLGVLALVDPDRTTTDRQAWALRHAAALLTTELAHQRAIAELELRLRRDLVEDLLTGVQDDSAYARAETLGHNLYPPHCVVVIDGAASDKALIRAVTRSAASLELSYLLTTRESTLVLIVEHTGEHGAKRWNALHRRVTSALSGQNVTIGVGEPAHRPADIPRSWKEATRAHSVRRSSHRPQGVTTYDDLGFIRLLGATGGGTQDLDEFVQRWLGVLLDYDARHKSGLVKTLSTYLECGGNYDDTAAAVHVHRSTLRYRLARIRDLTGYDFHDPDQHLNLHLAIRLLSLMKAPAARTH
ncbi:PucR family transcriptional regulator [Pseudonocardia sp. H11422]|uniref:PucR family transcriptional regulator n=1 Tax=Pseudonocardia sp. H11422 TaxID=2835866 RepID=UPI001BDC6BFA|nr:helix-turn-helix domain-containing protein [Pseudonocardia sp. H11422]